MGDDLAFSEEERALMATYRLVSDDAAEQVRAVLVAKHMGIINAKFEDGQLKVFPVGWDKSPTVIDRVRLAAYDKLNIAGVFGSIFVAGLAIGALAMAFIEGIRHG